MEKGLNKKKRKEEKFGKYRRNLDCVESKLVRHVTSKERVYWVVVIIEQSNHKQFYLLSKTNFKLHP